MKTTRLFLSVILTVLFFTAVIENHCMAQVTVASNIATTSGDYVGWDATIANPPLKIMTKKDDAINFYTNGTYRARIGNSSEFSLIVGDATNALYNNIDIQCTGTTPASEGYRYNGGLILCTPFIDNLLVGNVAGGNLTGNYSTMVGNYAGYYTTGDENTMIGYFSGYNNAAGTQNTFVGSFSGYSNVDAYYNTFLGEQAGYNNTYGGENTFTGAYSGSMNSTAQDNTFNGFASGSNSTGSRNTFMGAYSGFDNTGNENTFIGEYCGYTNTTGRLNVYLGYYAGSGSEMDTTHDNVIIGPYAGTSVGSGNFNVLVGSNSQLADFVDYNYSCGIGYNSWVQGNNSVAIGANTTVGDDNCIVLGNDPVRILMGYIYPPTVDTTARLYVNPISGPRAAYFNGSIATTGVHFLVSDRRLKNEIQPMGDVKSILNKLSPKTYMFDQKNHSEMNLPSGLQYGLIAQEVETVLPGLVETEFIPPVTDSKGKIIKPSDSFKAVNYTGLIPILLNGLKQQQGVIDSLTAMESSNKSRIDQLEKLINSYGSNSIRNSEKSSAKSIDVELSSENTIILNQNDPNPFAEQTRITYSVPSDVKEAKIIFFNNTGHVMQTVTINERGNGQINVYGEKLSSGMYSYSLIADGKVIDTKKMICNK